MGEMGERGGRAASIATTIVWIAHAISLVSPKLVLVRACRWDTMACVTLLDQFLRYASLLTLPCSSPTSEDHTAAHKKRQDIAYADFC